MTSRFVAAALAALMTFFVALSGQALAQGFNLGQLLGSGGVGGAGGGGGGGGGGSRHQSSDGSGVSVERSTPPFTGKFIGKQEDQGAETTMTAQFACYPAHDVDIPQSNAFLCYTGGSNAGSPSPVSSSDRHAYAPPGGRPSYGPPDGDPPNGPPSGVE